MEDIGILWIRKSNVEDDDDGYDADADIWGSFVRWGGNYSVSQAILFDTYSSYDLWWVPRLRTEILDPRLDFYLALANHLSRILKLGKRAPIICLDLLGAFSKSLQDSESNHFPRCKSLRRATSQQLCLCCLRIVHLTFTWSFESDQGLSWNITPQSFCEWSRNLHLSEAMPYSRHSEKVHGTRCYIPISHS
jgi:hypothetical protein